MKHTELCVQSTKNYEKFKTLVGNRGLNIRNVELIKNSMMEKQLIVPAIVNERMEIIDGQHRRAACEELGLPFYYIIVDGYRLDDVQRMNSNMKNWALVDFLHAYIDLYNGGHKQYRDYVKLKAFMDDYQLDLSSALELSNIGIGKKAYEEIFKHGNFSFPYENKARIIIEEMIELLRGFDEKKWKTRTFISAYIKLHMYENYEFSHMLKKTQPLANGTRNSAAFHELSGLRAILNALVEAYNHGTPRINKLATNDVEYAFDDYVKGLR